MGTGADFRDLVGFNRWLCITRVRAASAVLAFVLALHLLGVGAVSTTRVLGVCAGLFAVSAIGLTSRRLADAPRLFFHLQSLADLAGITLGIAFSARGIEALLFRPIFALVIIPASLISVPSGLLVAVAATAGHEALLAGERGFSLATAGSVESLFPPFLFFLVAQQCFFYGAHLKRKNVVLGKLAARLEDSRQQLAEKGRMSAALLEVARALSSTLEAPELLSRVNRTARHQLGADWSATFLVDAARATFRLAAISDASAAPAVDLGGLELPLGGWLPVERLTTQPFMVLDQSDAQRVAHVFAAGRASSTVLLAALYRDGALSGFLAVGYARLAEAERKHALDLLTGITQHATLVLRNAHLLEEARQASALKSEFLATMSHELRTPLNVILGYLEMLLDQDLGGLTDEQSETVRRTQRQSLALLEMITGLLDVNRLEAGRLPVERAAVVVGDLLGEVMQQLPESWHRPDVHVQLAVIPRLPVIQTDAGKLKTVVRNLLHNALKFTEHGHVTVAARLAPAGDLAITVTDTGRGIPREAIGQIFGMFQQLPGSGGGGVGLGLHIVQRFVDALGGTVTVTSEVGRGSCFTITLPLTAAAAPAGDRPHSSPTAHAA